MIKPDEQELKREEEQAEILQKGKVDVKANTRCFSIHLFYHISLFLSVKFFLNISSSTSKEKNLRLLHYAVKRKSRSKLKRFLGDVLVSQIFIILSKKFRIAKKNSLRKQIESVMSRPSTFPLVKSYL